MRLAAADAPPEQLCGAVLAVQQLLLGLLLPVLVSAYNWQPDEQRSSSSTSSSAATADEAEAAAATGSGAAAVGSRPGGQTRRRAARQQQAPTAWLHVQAGRLAAWSSRALLESNELLSAAAGTGRGIEAAAATWLLLAGCIWWECRAAMGL